jgi:hypothetical protein
MSIVIVNYRKVDYWFLSFWKMEGEPPHIPPILDAHLDHYGPTDSFLCPFCDVESNNGDFIFGHLRECHNFVLANVLRIPLIPEYLKYWKTHEPPLVLCRDHLRTIDCNSKEDQELRAALHKRRLEKIMEEHEIERSVVQSNMKCLFCNDVFEGTWHEYLQWLFEKHQFNPGRPANLIFIPDLVDVLGHELDSNICIYCKSVFPNQRTLKSHMRKKKHMRIPSESPIYDRFYVCNYLNPDGKGDVESESEYEEESEESLETAAEDFSDVEINETVCLICDSIFENPLSVIMHMREVHKFNIAEVTKALGNDFYDSVRFVNYSRFLKARNRCFICGHDVDTDYVMHVEAHANKVPDDFGMIKGEDQLLIPFFDEDPLLTELENDI